MCSVNSKTLQPIACEDYDPRDWKECEWSLGFEGEGALGWVRVPAPTCWQHSGEAGYSATWQCSQRRGTETAAARHVGAGTVGRGSASQGVVGWVQGRGEHWR